MERRELLKSAVSSAAGLTILKSGTLRGQSAPSNKLNIALIGVWGRGTAHYGVLRNENVVALCDVNDTRTKEDLLGLAGVSRPEGHRRGRDLHRGSPSRLHRQLGVEPRQARLLRKAAGHH